MEDEVSPGLTDLETPAETPHVQSDEDLNQEIELMSEQEIFYNVGIHFILSAKTPPSCWLK